MAVFDELKELLVAQGDAFLDFKSHYEGRLSGVEEVLVKLQRPFAPGGPMVPGGDPEYKQAFLGMLRTGRDDDLQRKAMRVSVDPDGGYAVPKEMDSVITKALRELSPMRQLARVIPVQTDDFKMLHSVGGTAYAWVGETASRPATNTPTFMAITPSAGEIYANPAVTQKLLDDAGFDIESWLVGEVAEAFGEGEGAAFITGDGINKPHGLTNYDVSADADGVRANSAFQYVASGAAGAFAASNPSDKLIKLVHALKPAYRVGAAWLMNSNTLEQIRAFKDGQGQYLWRPGLEAGQPSMLLGYPVYEDANMPDIAANSLSIAFGNFERGYVILDRVSRMLRDPFTNKPYVHFYTTRRVAGGARDTRAIKFLKFAAS